VKMTIIVVINYAGLGLLPVAKIYGCICCFQLFFTSSNSSSFRYFVKLLSAL